MNKRTFNIDVTKEMNMLIWMLNITHNGGAGSAIGGLLRKNYENTLIGQLNGLVDFGILEKPADGFKIDLKVVC